MEYKILDKVNSPADLKELKKSEIPELCSEIRSFLIDNIEQTGGHLASNLGVTELTVALHRVFDSPNDHIIFDVGHQSYIHKMLTGRKGRFSELRKTGGMSGFPLMKESEHDAFGAGHSSTSISAALGYAEADKLRGRDNFSIAVLGDGAYTGGMIHEALNNCNPDLKLVIILNENGMSISVNKGRFASYMSRARISKKYRGLKKTTRSVLKYIPLIGKPISAFLAFTKQTIKNAFLSPNYFEDLGLYYIGPIDGNNYSKVEAALRDAKTLGQCVIVHIKTQKGKGYEPAEKSPDNFHSIGKPSQESIPKTYHEVFADTLIEMAETDPDIVAITAAMGIGTGLCAFEEKFPKRYFDVGIAEEHALTFSAGLAASGLKPYVAIYSTFLQRGYDNIIHDIALQELPVRLMIDRAGLATSDGATHHGIFDVAFLSHVPGMRIYAPVSNGTLEALMKQSENASYPIAIRYPNAAESQKVKETFYSDGEYGDIGIKCTDGIETEADVFITYGRIVENVIGAKEIIESEGKSSGIVLLEQIKPYDRIAELIKERLRAASRIVFVEEGIKNGGAGMILRDALDTAGFDFRRCTYKTVAIDEEFAAPSEPCDIYEYLGMSKEKLAENFMRK